MSVSVLIAVLDVSTHLHSPPSVELNLPHLDLPTSGVRHWPWRQHAARLLPKLVDEARASTEAARLAQVEASAASRERARAAGVSLAKPRRKRAGEAAEEAMEEALQGARASSERAAGASQPADPTSGGTDD